MLLFWPGTELRAGNWYVGIGLQDVALEDDFEELPRGLGAVFLLGYRVSRWYAWDIAWGGSNHDPEPGREETRQTNLFGGIKLLFSERQVQPYVTAGLSWNAVDVDPNEEVIGFGAYAGLGADVFFAARHAVGAGWRRSVWRGEDDSNNEFDVTTDVFSIAYSYHFGR